jgi:hypothetical protein
MGGTPMSRAAVKSLRGQSGIEFFITMFAFTVIFFAIGDMIRICYAWGGIQYATNRGVRLYKTLSSTTPEATRIDAVENEINRVTTALNIPLDGNDIDIKTTGNTLEANTHKSVNLGPVAGMILKMAGDHSGVYDLRVREVIRNESY